MQVLISIGCNRGCCQDTLTNALKALDQPSLRLVAASPRYLTQPVGNTDQPPFLNACAIFQTNLQPDTVLKRLLSVEKRFGRVRDPRDRFGPRTLDLDLLLADDIVQNSNHLAIIPHPRMHERAFVLVPAADIAKNWRHPILGQSIGELLEAIDTAGVDSDTTTTTW